MAASTESVILNLDEYDASTFTKYLYDCYKADLRIHIDARFEGDSNFRVNILEHWIFIEVDSDHSDMVKLLETYPVEHKLIGMLPEIIKYNFYKYETGFYDIEDFQIIPQMWKLHRQIKSIKIVSHNIIFKRFSPPSLKFSCLQLIDVNLLQNLPAHVLKKLDGFKEQKTPKVEGKPHNKDTSTHFKVRFTLTSNEPTRSFNATNDIPVEQNTTNDIPAVQGATNDIPTEQGVIIDIPVKQDVSNDNPGEQDVISDIPIERDATNDILIERNATNDIPAEQDVINNTSIERDAKSDIPAERDVINDIPVEQPTAGPSTGQHQPSEELDERIQRLRQAIEESDELDELDLFGRLTTLKLRNLPAFERERIICHIDSLFNIQSSVCYPAPPPMLPDAQPWILTHNIFAPPPPNQDLPPPPPNYNMDVPYLRPTYNLHFE